MQKVYKPTPEVALTVDEKIFNQTIQTNEMNPVMAVFYGLVNLGTDVNDHGRESKYIRAFNFIAALTFAITLVYLVLAIFWEKPVWVALLSAAEVICFTALVLNGYGLVNVSRYLYITAINLLIYFSAVLVGPQANIEHHLILSVALPFLILDYRKNYGVVYATLLPVILLYTYSLNVLNLPAFNLSTNLQLVIAQVGIFSQTLVLLAMVVQFVRSANASENELQASKGQMQVQTSELRRSNSDLEQFAYIISHDLKAPVRNISSFMNLLQVKYAPEMSEEAREFVNYSHQGAKRLERLIDDVLAYCRIGTNLPSPVPVNLNDVVNTISFELRDRVSSVNGEINIQKELPVINHVHASLMYHIFQNLISNGLKFNHSEKPSIEVSWSNSLNHYTFSVHDNGIGISKEYSATIFQMFKRLHTEHEFDGTGIGLAICKKIVEHYHGEIWFESSSETGTTFFFTVRKF
jgi:signal transduction histidine kinase